MSRALQDHCEATRQIVAEFSKVKIIALSMHDDLLSPREREVLQLLAEGKGSSQIAESLHINVKTVETHRAQFIAKVKIKSVAELTKFAIREGLTMV